MRADKNRSDVKAELELEEPMELGGDASTSEDEGSRSIITTLVECREPTAMSAGGGREVERRGDIPASRKRAASSDAVGEREAKRTRSLCPSKASPALPPPAPGVAG